jgi:hypothetical protein
LPDLHVLEHRAGHGRDQRRRHRNTVIRYPNANHALRDVATGEPVSVWDDMMSWLRQSSILVRRDDLSVNRPMNLTAACGFRRNLSTGEGAVLYDLRHSSDYPEPEDFE